MLPLGRPARLGRLGRCAGGAAVAVLLAGACATVSANAAAQGCGEDGATWVGASAGVGAATGIAGALGSAGIIVGADDTRDFDFGIGAGVGLGVSLGLAGLYAIVDGSSGCSMTHDAGGFVWSVPLTTFLVGAALPVAVWGASDEEKMLQTDQAALRTGALRSNALTATGPLHITLSF